MNSSEFHAAVLAELRGIRALLAGDGDADATDGASRHDAFGPRDATTGDPVPPPYQSTPTVGAVRGKHQPDVEMPAFKREAARRVRGRK